MWRRASALRDPFRSAKALRHNRTMSYHPTTVVSWRPGFMSRTPALAFCLFAAAAAPIAAQDRTIDLLRQLADAPGPPGFEEPIRKVMVEQMKPYASSITFDGMGSIIATQGTQGPRIMVDAHMDELGGLVRRVTNDGNLTMQMLGGWLDQALVDQRWIIIGSKGPVRAITGIRDIHIVPQEERTKVYPRESVFLDVGARNAAEVAAMGLEPGDPVVPDAPFAVMNGTQNYLGKGWDDRVGCAVVIEAMKKLAHAPHPNQISGWDAVHAPASSSLQSPRRSPRGHPNLCPDSFVSRSLPQKARPEPRDHPAQDPLPPLQPRSSHPHQER